MHLPSYLGLLERAEQELAASFREVGTGHAAEADVFHTCNTLAAQCDEHVKALRPFIERYGETDAAAPGRHRAAAVPTARTGSIGLLRDLHDLAMLVSYVEMAWTIVSQAAQALRDAELGQAVSTGMSQTSTQSEWLRTRIKQAAPQTLLVAS